MKPDARKEKLMNKPLPSAERIKQLMLEPQFQNMYKTIKRACEVAEEEGHPVGDYDDFEPSSLHKAQVRSCEDQLMAKGYTGDEILATFAVIDSIVAED
jgi:hypothetical protein